MHTLVECFWWIALMSSGGWAGVKKSSNRARRQRDDRAFAEFDAMMRRLARTTQPKTLDERVGSDRYQAGEKEQTGSNATQE